jgi:hypothetical protein
MSQRSAGCWRKCGFFCNSKKPRRKQRGTLNGFRRDDPKKPRDQNQLSTAGVLAMVAVRAHRDKKWREAVRTHCATATVSKRANETKTGPECMCQSISSRPAEQGRGADCLQRPLVPRSRFQQQLTPSVRRLRRRTPKGRESILAGTILLDMDIPGRGIDMVCAVERGQHGGIR